MAEKLPLLVVDDEVDILTTLRAYLGRAGYSVSVAATAEEALQALCRREFPLVIADLRMPGMGGERLLAEVVERYPRTSVIVLTGYGSIEGAVEAMKRGAKDYVTKPCIPEELLLRVRRVLEARALEQENITLRREIDRRWGQEAIIGESPQIKEVLRLINVVAPTDSRVLVQGESGTGKELVARAIHHKSQRKNKSFVKISCAAIPEGLLEAELFGYEKGAFTDAYERRIGRFEMAHQGTLFLDEIGDTPPNIQAKLLRVLEEQEFGRLGGNTTIKVDVRLICATNQELLGVKGERSFRPDLYYRINVVPIYVPPLRERKQDIPLLANLFLERSAAATGKTVKSLQEAALGILMGYDWPGNVRELENAIERAVVLCQGISIGPEDLDFLTASGSVPQNGPLPLAQVERAHIEQVLRMAQGNKAQAARVLGIQRETLYQKLRKYGLDSRSP